MENREFKRNDLVWASGVCCICRKFNGGGLEASKRHDEYLNDHFSEKIGRKCIRPEIPL